jgi:glycosyltransferase involved in cell wall biosynthesis
MHVLHYVPNYFEPVGGRENFVRELTKHLQRFGVKQSILTNSKDGTSSSIAESDGIIMYSLRAKKYGAYMVLFGASRILRENNYDVIHIHGYGDYCADLVCLLKRLRSLSTPAVMTTHGVTGLKHGYDALDSSSALTFSQRLARLPHLIYDGTIGKLEVRTFEKIVLLSSEEQQLLHKIGLRKDRTVEIPIAISDLFFAKSSYSNHRRDYLLYVGRIDEYKGLPTLARAMKELKSSRKIHLKCLVIGKDYGYKSRFESLIKELDIQDQIELKDFVAHDELFNFYSSALATILPSSSEGFPLALVESMAAGTPYISTPVGAIEQLTISSKAGLLIPIGDWKSLANAITTLVRDENLWYKMSDNCRYYAANFTWDNIARRYFQLYQEMVVE